MRQSQQNKRTRGRGRKPSNPGNRVHESNGPDVKIRGSASHIAEKYVTLARDAHVSGDRIIAESYLQHAEHYFRIIAATQSQQVQGHQPRPAQTPSEQAEANTSKANGVNQTEQTDSHGKDEAVATPASGENGSTKSAASRTRRRRRPEAASGSDPAQAKQPNLDKSGDMEVASGAESDVQQADKPTSEPAAESDTQENAAAETVSNTSASEDSVPTSDPDKATETV